MNLENILYFSILALLIRLLIPRGRNPLLLVSSVLAIYWLQPISPIRNLDFWIPTATIFLVALSWVLTTPRETLDWQKNRLTAGVIAVMILLIGLTRFISLTGLITASRPPRFELILIALLFLPLIIWLTGNFKRSDKKLLPAVALFIIILIALKSPQLSELSSKALRLLMGQSGSMASAVDIQWLGFSYLSFRIIHTLRDRQNGRLPSVSLSEYFIYVIFFPAFTAGPIARLERFIKDLRKPLDRKNQGELINAGKRLFMGLFKKFVLANGLALFSISSQNVLQVEASGWMWLMTYAYALQIFFDFSGYTDIAIGMGQMLGIQLPENFNRPYLKPNLTQFWNNWHMTLTQWFRAYFFNPVTRSLRRSGTSISPVAIIFITQVSTMLLIGLWHGITWNFVIWGLWHGAGMFIHNRWADWLKPHTVKLDQKPVMQKALNGAGVFLTFNFVSLGWVWFALSNTQQSLYVFRILFGG